MTAGGGVCMLSLTAVDAVDASHALRTTSRGGPGAAISVEAPAEHITRFGSDIESWCSGHRVPRARPRYCARSLSILFFERVNSNSTVNVG